LLAYWSFDEAAGPCLDHSGNNYHTAPVDNLSGQLSRTGGVFGRAMRFSGQHRLAVQGDGLPDFVGHPADQLLRLGPGHPVRPLQRDLPQRGRRPPRAVLVPGRWSVLALGLNVNGYVECDAPDRPEMAARRSLASLRGHVRREDVSRLSGRQRDRFAHVPGNITAGGSAPGCIGSTNGGECLQGMMDDLRIYTEALSADEVARLYLNGIEAISLADKQVAEYLAKVYQAAPISQRP
jgi:hypothetical protein